MYDTGTSSTPIDPSSIQKQGIKADNLTKEELEELEEFATVIQEETAAYLPRAYEVISACSEEAQGVTINIQILHGQQPIGGTQILVDNVKQDKTETESEQLIKETSQTIVAQAISEIIQQDNGPHTPTGS